MAWTSPITWVVGLVSAATMNAQVRDNLTFLWTAHGCRVFLSSTQTVLSGNTDVISWTGEDFDSDSLHSTASNQSRIGPIPTGLDGKWQFWVDAGPDADGTQNNARFTLTLRKNAAGASGGGTLLKTQKFPAHSEQQSAVLHWAGPLIVGDYVEAFFFSGGEQRVLDNLTDGSSLTAFWRGG